jgi:hypothetical protein
MEIPMHRTLLTPLLSLLVVLPAVCQYGGRDGDVVIYAVSAKGNANPVIVAAGTVNTATGFEIRDPLTLPQQPFGPDFPGEFFVDLHNEPQDNFRYIIQKEDIFTGTNEFLGPGKVLIIQGVDRLVIPNKEPIDLTAGLFAPFPQGTDFGPELPILEANSFLWTPAPFFPLISKRPDGFIGPNNPSGKTGSEYVLDLGSFIGILRWVGFQNLYGSGWPQGIDSKMIEQDTALGSTARLIRLRPGRTTPPFLIRANTHLAVLSGRVEITPTNGTTRVLTARQYAFIPNGFAIVLSNPAKYSGPTAE